jgi:HK97 family phage prohead protease
MKVEDYIKSLNPNAERRFFVDSLAVAELRASGDVPSGQLVEGLGIVYNSLSENFAPYWEGGYYELIEPGAAAGLLDDEDIMILFNHDPSLVLARNKNTGTLTETDKGVKYSYASPDTSVAKDLLVNIGLKNVRKSSFAFKVKEQREEKISYPGLGVINLRRIISFEKLYDFSPVTYPAYADSEVGKRSMQTIAKPFDPAIIKLRQRELQKSKLIFEL